jgi:hypothetical protein
MTTCLESILSGTPLGRDDIHMGVLEVVSLNLLSAFIGFLAGVAWRRGWQRFQFRKTRLFWGWLLSSPPLFVLGELGSILLVETLQQTLNEFDASTGACQAALGRLIAHLDDQENSGLIGRGDVAGVFYIYEKLAEARLPKGSLASVEQVDTRSAKNLILFGGDDVNPLSGDLIRRLGCTLTFGRQDGKNVVKDEVLGSYYAVEKTVGDQQHGVSTKNKDFSLLILAHNPYVAGGQVLVLAGAQGLGTLAAARACFEQQEEILHRVKEGQDFECLVSYEESEAVTSPPRIRIELTRELRRAF